MFLKNMKDLMRFTEKRIFEKRKKVMLEEYYRAYAKIDLDCIKHNMQKLKNNVREDVKMVAVIKTDGYGHGAIPIAKAITDLVEAYAVATIDEAMNLRRHGIEKPIYLLGFIHGAGIKCAIENEIRAAVYEYETAKLISDMAVELSRIAKIHIKIDTGMSRLGFKPNEESLDTLCRIKELPNVEIEGIFTHFAASDEKDKSSARKQLELYNDFVSKLKDKGLDIKIKHCSNSAGIVDMPEANMNEVRAGIALYGLYPSEDVNKGAVPLKPALELKSHIIFLKEVEEGVGVSYGSTFVTNRKSKIATIPIGYGDGYPRNLSNKGSVLIRGKRAPIVGRVCMDQFMVDVTDVENVASGDEVTLIGKDLDEMISVEEIASLAGTFNYELVCNLGKRIPRVYIEDGNVICKKDYFFDAYDFSC